MKFTFNEWKNIHHAMGIAKREYEKLMNNSKPSNSQYSSYQVFKSQAEEMDNFMDRIANAEL